MPAFDEEDWTRFDFGAIAGDCGVAAIEETDRESCRQWLVQQGYRISTLDASGGFARFIREYNDLMRWEDRFGYSLSEQRCKLDAVRDGFELDASSGNGRVLELYRFDCLWRDAANWATQFLAIASEHTRVKMALGQRAFTVLVLAHGSPMQGVAFDRSSVPPVSREPWAAKKLRD